MTFELKFPDETSPTASWTPSKEPVKPSRQRDDDGVITDLMADRARLVAYTIGSFAREYEHHFTKLTATDKANFDTFRAAARGGSFKLKDPSMSSYVKVKFAPDGFTREWEWAGNCLWDVVLRFREVA